MRTRPLAVFLAPFALAGCSASAHVSFGDENVIDIGKARSTITRAVQTRYALSPRSVTCPKAPKLKKGTVFTCVAHFAVGTAAVPITETDSKGKVLFNYTGLRLVAIDVVEQRIAASIKDLLRVTVTVRCPASVVERKGLNFTCTATDGTNTRRVAVTQGTDGNVHYKLI